MAENENIEVPQSTIVAQESKTVGDDNLEAREPTAQVTSETTAAQVSPPREDAAAEVPVHEVYVATDTVITDPSDPLAVQVPDAGRGDASLPIHDLAGPTVEQVFADTASEESTPSNEEREQARVTGTTVESARGSSDES